MKILKDTESNWWWEDHFIPDKSNSALTANKFTCKICNKVVTDWGEMQTHIEEHDMRVEN